MTEFIQKHIIFISLALVYILIGGVVVYITEHGDSVLWLDNHHYWLSDLYFKLCNLFGEGIYIALFLVAFAFKNWRQATFVGLSLAANSGITQGLKHYFNKPRPYKYFWDIHDTFHYIIPVEDVNTDFSFPSGHTNGSFTLFFCLAILASKNKTAQAVLAILAISTAISRLVMFQHFLIDTVAGAGIALLITTLVYFIVKQIPYIKEGLSE